MEEIIEQEKHEIALLAENILYIRIRAYKEDDSIDDETKTKLKNQAVEAFVEYCVEKYKTLTPEQIREHVLLKLNKTIDNIEKLKEQDER